MGEISSVTFSSAILVMAVILIVEDELFIRQVAEWILGELGHDILLAEDLAEALVHLKAAPAIDALFVDIRLDRLPYGGYDVANQAIMYWPALRVLYTSGSPLTDEMKEMFVEGGQFLQKPYSSAQLEKSVGDLLQ